jgi:hypothetical protein
MQAIPASSAQPFLYFALQSSNDATFNGLPKFTLTLASAAKNQGQFYAWMYDTATKNWMDLAPISVSGAQVTFGGSTKKLTLKAGTQYVAVPFTAAPAASCPTPPPTPPPTPTPPPISGKWFDTSTDSGGNTSANAAFNTFDEQTGHQLATLPLGYPSGVFGSSIELTKDGNTAYVAGYGPLVNGNPSTFPLPGLTIINTSTNVILHQTTIDGGIDAGALSTDQTRWYGVGEDVNGNEFFVFDASSGALLQTIPMPQQFYQIVVNPASNVAYLPGNSQIYRMNLATGTLSTLNASLTGTLAIDPTGAKLFAVQNDAIAILDTTTGRQIGSISLPTGGYFFFGGSASYAPIEARDLRFFVVEENNTDGSWSHSMVSTVDDRIVNTFHASDPNLDSNSPAVNGSGSFAVLFAPSNEPPIPVGGVALPLGQSYFEFTPQSTAIPYGAAAQ